MEQKRFDKAMEAVVADDNEGSVDACLAKVRALKKTLLAEAQPDAEQIGWTRYYEFRSLYGLEDWKQGLKMLEKPEAAPFTIEVQNSAWMHSVGAEMAMHLGRAEDVARLAGKAVDLRGEAGDAEMQLAVSRTACVMLAKMGRADLNTRFAKLLLEKGASTKIKEAVADGIRFAQANVKLTRDRELKEALADAVKG